MMTKPVRGALVMVLAVSWGASGLRAGDWPQILGPNRDGTAPGEKLPASLPEGGVEAVWEHEVGSGFAGPAVVGETVVAFHRVGDQESVEGLDRKTGRRLWRAEFPATYRASIVPNNGPLCTPLVAGGRVYVFGAAADLHCVSLEDGDKLWSRNLREDYNVPPGYFGSGSSPILVDGKLLLNVGGPGAGLAAFDPQTGRTIWKGTDLKGSYSSPVAATINGRQQVVFVTRLNCVSVDPASGKEYFNFPFGQRGPTVNGATPVVIGEHVFLTASYGIGAVWSKVTPSGAKEVWSSDEVLSSQYTTPVYHDGYFYGLHGRQDVGVAELRCIDPEKGRVAWKKEDFGYATVILADGKLLVLTTDGNLVLAAASPDGYRELGRTRVATSTCRALPALSDGRLYLRDEEHLKCFDLAP